MDNLAREAAHSLTLLKNRGPLIHNITNFVVMNFTANVLLAAGASPVMAHAEDEVEEMVSLASALVLNLGTLSSSWVRAMVKAAEKARFLGIPIVLDPVGAGATRLRTDSAKIIAEKIGVSVIRGNSSEILSLATGGYSTKGVDALHDVDEAGEVARKLAEDLGTTIAITGEVDLVTDGKRVVRVANGHPMMPVVTGTGCAATAVIGAFAAVGDDPLAAAAGGLACFGLAGEKAAAVAKGPASFAVALIDSLFGLTEDELLQGARIVEG
ncbi:hydroxyethylthiazole kinase [Desulforhopalus singaporensis]|uniref:Hydroxyethylthiazole kinase n=1 Tax=Desulforhopalus singaporensis TaxID=91360 RepID=A0A1H0UIG8_9BACT|nr:hydroxyethylthiazole kinase [Desulforhopalus singaporensis]SDP65870.1 hydroxyethylthiazole kinase [Desulforhopalus singaporensis]